jgi:hypothetical protein
MGERLSGESLSDLPSERGLDSWKEIASSLGRDVTTVQRRERRQGMPFHRHKQDRRRTVYTLTSETILDSEQSVVCPDNVT